MWFSKVIGNNLANTLWLSDGLHKSSRIKNGYCKMTFFANVTFAIYIYIYIYIGGE